MEEDVVSSQCLKMHDSASWGFLWVTGAVSVLGTDDLQCLSPSAPVSSAGLALHAYFELGNANSMLTVTKQQSIFYFFL